MSTFVLYDSQYGNTERIARTIAGTLSEFGQVRAICASQAQPGEFREGDLLILGCPTQGLRPTQAMQSFLGNIPRESLSGLAVACFDTRFRRPQWLWKHSAAPRMAEQLRAMGVEPLVPPESFFVKGKKGPLEASEVERATSWALGIHQQHEALQPHLVAQKP